MFSGVPLPPDIVRRGRHVAKVPIAGISQFLRQLKKKDRLATVSP